MLFQHRSVLFPYSLPYFLLPTSYSLLPTLTPPISAQKQYKLYTKTPTHPHKNHFSAFLFFFLFFFFLPEYIKKLISSHSPSTFSSRVSLCGTGCKSTKEPQQKHQMTVKLGKKILLHRTPVHHPIALKTITNSTLVPQTPHISRPPYLLVAPNRFASSKNHLHIPSCALWLEACPYHRETC